MVRDQHFWKSQAQFLPETLKSFRLLLHPLQKNHYYMYWKCLLNCFIAMIKRDFMTHWYEVLDTLKSVNGKAKLRLMKMLIQSYNNTKVTNNTFETNCSSLKITTPSNFFFCKYLKFSFTSPLPSSSSSLTSSSLSLSTLSFLFLSIVWREKNETN